MPQGVPAFALAESRHCIAPVEQSLTPVLQGLPGLVVHAWLPTQVTHCPLPLQTRLLPQVMPPTTFVLSLQPGVAPHAVTPALHGNPGLLLHTMPAAQLMHVPWLQILSVPQWVPAVTSSPSRHRGVPVVQDNDPFLHGALALPEQLAPSEQEIHAPVALHTWPAPHGDPTNLTAALAQVTEAPQAVAPSRHGSELVVHI